MSEGREERCYRCAGSGKNKHGGECDGCQGEGRVQEFKCPDCDGSGVFGDEDCPYCIGGTYTMPLPDPDDPEMMGRYTRPRAGAASSQPPQRERHLQDRLIQTAQLCGWTGATSAGEQIDLIYHTHRSDKSPIGFPDLAMVRDGVLLALECKRGLKEVVAMPKSARGRAQLAWIEALAQVPGVHAAVISPENEALAMSWITERRR